VTAKEFQKDTGVKLENVRLPSGRLYERIVTEYGAKQLRADVIRLSDGTFVEDMKKRGILAPYKFTSWDKLDAQHKEKDGYYVSSILAIMAIGYNTAKVPADTAPKGWKDLLNPRWKGQVGMSHAGTGGSTWSAILYQRKTFGVEYWKALAAQKPVILTSAASVAEELSRGEFNVAVNSISAIGQVIENGAPVDVVFPAEGVPLFPMYLAVASTSANPNAARLFMNWAMSKKGQTFTVQAAADYVPRKEAPAPKVKGKQWPELAKLHPYVPPTEDWIGLRNQWVKEWNQMFGYTP
jgi:iron(III) transport system substrate-binding protein